MKRLICLLLTVIAMLSLVGCNDDLEKKIEELEYKIDDYDRITSNMIDDDKWLLGMIQDLQADKVLLNIKITELEEKIAKNEQDISKSEEENDSLNAQLTESQAEIERLKEQLAKSEKELNSVLDVLCDEKIDDYYGTEPEPGVECIWMPDVAIGYRYLKVPYNIENVNINAYLGVCAEELIYGEKPMRAIVQMWCEYYNDEGHLIAIPGEYNVGCFENIHLEKEKYVFWHYEDVSEFSDLKANINVKIPQELIAYESGVVYMHIYLECFTDNSWEAINGVMNIIPINYKKADGYVFLYK